MDPPEKDPEEPPPAEAAEEKPPSPEAPPAPREPEPELESEPGPKPEPKSEPATPVRAPTPTLTPTPTPTPTPVPEEAPPSRLRRRAAPSAFEGSSESAEGGGSGDSGDDYAPTKKKKKAEKPRPKCAGTIRIASVESLSKNCEAREAFASMRAEAAAISARLRDRCAKLDAKADVQSVGGALRGISAAFEAFAATKAELEAAEARFRREFGSSAKTRGWRQHCEGLPKLLESIDDGEDSDCEVVEEIPSPVGGDVYAALKRMESQGVSWKNTKAPREMDPPIRLKDVTVKRVKRTEPDFFRPDGRERRPPDKRVADFADRIAINGPDGNRISSKILSPTDSNLNMRKAKRRIDQLFKTNFGRQIINYENPINIMRLIKSGKAKNPNSFVKPNPTNGAGGYRKIEKSHNNPGIKGPHLLKPIKIVNEINFDPVPQYGKHLSNSNNKDIFSELFHSQLEKMKQPP